MITEGLAGKAQEKIEKAFQKWHNTTGGDEEFLEEANKIIVKLCLDSAEAALKEAESSVQELLTDVREIQKDEAELAQRKKKETSE